MNNVNGILLVVGAMAAFALEDMFIKLLSVTVPTGQIMVVLGVVCGLLFAALAVATRKRILDPHERKRAVKAAKAEAGAWSASRALDLCWIAFILGEWTKRSTCSSSVADSPGCRVHVS